MGVFKAIGKVSGKSEGCRTKVNHITAKKFNDSSESHCENAFEILQEIVAADAS